MIADCMNVFRDILQKRGDAFVLDNYQPKNGTYYIVTMGENWTVREPVTIFYDKKKGTVAGRENTSYPLICRMDYYSKLISMNKPIDSKKVIHSNNYLSMAVKKESITEGKLSQEIIYGYYDILKNPRAKYKSARALKLYEKVEEEVGKVDEALLEQIKSWLSSNLSELTKDLSGKDYLKIFFVYDEEEKTREMYKREGKRYLIPNIYNNNDFNEEINGMIKGMPDNNIGMNSKKPYLANKSRKKEIPYYLELNEVLEQAKFFDYLDGAAAKGKTHLYFDDREKKIICCQSGEIPEYSFTGYYLNIYKEKEVQIRSAQVITGLNPNMAPTFYYTDFVGAKENQQQNSGQNSKQPEEEQYGAVTGRTTLLAIIDEVFFGKSLSYNLFAPIDKLTIQDKGMQNYVMQIRDDMIQWLICGNRPVSSEHFAQVFQQIIVRSVLGGYWKKLKHQMNLNWSIQSYLAEDEKGVHMEQKIVQIRAALKQHINMKEEWIFQDDDEYYFAVGQMLVYFLGKSKAFKKPLFLVNQILNAQNDQIVKEKMEYFFKKYNYDIDMHDLRVRNLYAGIMSYQPESRVNSSMVCAGMAVVNYIYEKKENE